MSKSKEQYDSDMWTLRCLMQDALIRRLREEAAEGGDALKGSELSPVNNYLKMYDSAAPDEKFNNIFDEGD